jgi:hypothetical protein
MAPQGSHRTDKAQHLPRRIMVLMISKPDASRVRTIAITASICSLTGLLSNRKNKRAGLATGPS